MLALQPLYTSAVLVDSWFFAAVVFLGQSAHALDVQRVVNGGETNYIIATLGIYLSIYNIFSNLLALLGIFGGDRD